MKLIKSIYKAPIEKVYEFENTGIVIVVLKYNNKLYEGRATLHPEDKDFFSRGVGRDIARSRARSKILKDEVKNLEQVLKYKKMFYYEVTHYKDEPETPLLLRMKNNIRHNENRLEQLRLAIVNEQEFLDTYLEDTDKALSSVKAMRAKVKDK